ncbi:hypothetical protein [Streptosporangium sp. NPDC049304]|uniref:hypothetical protein n=1 Tax=Streptosporangium sp. NPDC049304 TaxID=3154830 RepID=UPI003445F87C
MDTKLLDTVKSRKVAIAIIFGISATFSLMAVLADFLPGNMYQAIILFMLALVLIGPLSRKGEVGTSGSPVLAIANRIASRASTGVIGVVNLSFGVLVFVSDSIDYSIVNALMVFSMAAVVVRVLRIEGYAQELKQISVPTEDDLDERFSVATGHLIKAAADVALLQNEIQARAEIAKDLTRQAKESRERAERDREYAQTQRDAVEAIERLVAARADPLIKAIDDRSKRSQWLFVALGALLGTALQLLVEQFIK